ncbi:hypothetical protein FZ983_32170 [Azospirillum sp. B21]|uniref:hypothetical protein n=1 Tax=Azospirillum sp. B21 TaxID=2607496 RepID=UPI0011EFDB29|nr:hypothetical protein [Azospirillum sp. B21]KAA0572228.1 hypothetical protein FZ983_32170 [Azospirillum sp. B21]
MNRYDPHRRHGIPLFFKLWFAFVAALALSIIGAAVYAAITITPADVGRTIGSAVHAFEEARQ